MKTEDKSVKKMEKMVKIVSLFDNDKHIEYTPEDAYKAFVNKYPDVKMTQNEMYALLKDMYDADMLTRERRTVKSNPSGRVQTTSKFFYRPSKMINIINDELNDYIKKTKDPVADLEKIDLSKDLGTRLHVVSKTNIMHDKKEETPVQKDVKLSDDKGQLSFSEALLKVYNGQKIVSAVSGNVYSMMDEGNLKGITSSAKPGAVISFFPDIEMKGTWRLMESPKSCPYCGSMVKLVCNGATYQYMCTDKFCQAAGPHALTPEEAVIKFNTRM